MVNLEGLWIRLGFKNLFLFDILTDTFLRSLQNFWTVQAVPDQDDVMTGNDVDQENKSMLDTSMSPLCMNIFYFSLDFRDACSIVFVDEITDTQISLYI